MSNMLAMPELTDEAAQHERLGELLPRWLAEVPLYRRHGLDAGGDGGSPRALLRRLPLITKADIRRDFPVNFVGEGSDVEALVADEVIELEHTSGTSEERTPLLLPFGWWGEQELRALRLNAVVAEVFEQNPEARRVTLTSPVCSGDIRYTGTPARDERVIGNSLFVSLSRYPFLWPEAELRRMAGETAEWAPQFLDVDPVYGVQFALYCERRKLRFPSLRFVLCSYEFLSVTRRRILERVFGVQVFNLYGSTETGHLLMEDETGRMRPSPETALLELNPTTRDGVAELIVTTLTNPFMPLIRYRIGDLVERQEEPGGARYLVHGRVLESFSGPEGRLVTTWQLDQCFAGLDGIAHYQLVERGRDWLLRFVPDGAGPAPRGLARLQEQLAGLLTWGGPVTAQATDLLVPETSGKFRLGFPLKGSVKRKT
jgi:phenylacetate-CoA ligase